MNSTEDDIVDVLGIQNDPNKKSFLIRDILQSSSNNFHNSDNSTELPSSERLINWILQNQNNDYLEQTNETDSESDSILPILNEISKYSMFIQKDSIGTLQESWHHMTNQVANVSQNSLAFYQQLYYYALQNQLTSGLRNVLINTPESNNQTEEVEKESKILNECKHKIIGKKSKNNKISKQANNKEVVLLSSENKATMKQLSVDKEITVRLSSSKNRRNRTVFSELQLMGLERRFDSQKYLSTPDRADLARALGLTQLQVKTWYQNRRMKWKKQVMQNGCPFPPTKPKGRPKKDSIPTYGIEFTNSILSSIFTISDDSKNQTLQVINLSQDSSDLAS